MRISDWSSDVCSSDLFLALAVHRRRLFGRRLDAGDRLEQDDVEIGAIFVEEELDRWEAARSRDRVGLVDTADELFLLARRELEDLEPRPWPRRIGGGGCLRGSRGLLSLGGGRDRQGDRQSVVEGQSGQGRFDS